MSARYICIVSSWIWYRIVAVSCGFSVFDTMYLSDPAGSPGRCSSRYVISDDQRICNPCTGVSCDGTGDGTFGVNTEMVYIGASASLVLGWFLIVAFGLHSVFLVMVPLTVIAAVQMWRFLRDEITFLSGKQFDIRGMVLYAVRRRCFVRCTVCPLCRMCFPCFLPRQVFC